MVAISQQTLSMLLTIACIIVLAPTGLAQLFPPLIPIPGLPLQPGAPLPGLIPSVLSGGQECLSSLTSIPGCITEFFGSLFKGHISVIGPACCKAIIQISDNCWSKILPFNPFFLPIIKSFCAAPSSGLSTVSKVTLPMPFLPRLPGQDIIKCWSSFTNIEGCILEIYKSLINGQIGVISPACCKAVTEIHDNCWPKMFPFNPLFPPLLKSACAHVGGAAPPTPQAIGTSSKT